MYTILWTDHTGSRWARCENRLEVTTVLIAEDIRDDPDVIIFGPDADDYVLTTEDIFANI